MKYTVNHPSRFTGVRSRDGKSLNVCKLIPPFALGFTQAVIGITIEYMIMIFLSSLTNLMSIIMKFAAMAAVINFDNIYAASLFENKMKACAGKKLKTEFKRYMMHEPPELDHQKDNILNYASTNTRSAAVVVLRDPRRNSFCLQLLRFIHKSIRIFYVCFNYYFMPFVSLMITFGYAYTCKERAV